MSGEPFRKQVWEGDINVTPTSPGYCGFFDEFKCHAYMGGVPVRGEYRDDWTTCCGVDCPDADEAWEAAEAEVERLRGEVARQAEQITAVRALANRHEVGCGTELHALSCDCRFGDIRAVVNAGTS